MPVKDVIYEIEDKYLSPYAFKSRDTAGRRVFVEECKIRTEFQRDRDRIIHSKAFRRLKHKTQVFLSPEGDHYRTRLTHTLEVSSIARTVGRAVRLNEDLIEAIAMGHDLGHTPFGHAGERTLSALTGGAFSHNEQSVRVCEVLEKLNLTAEVLDGIREHRINGKPKTLEGRVVCYADRIAYVNHDIDDGIRAGLISENNLPEECVSVLGRTHRDRINNLVYNLVENSAGKPYITLSDEFEKALDGLRRYMFEHLYTKSEAKTEEVKAKRLIESLFAYFVNSPDELPGLYKNMLKDYDVKTVVCDYIAAMSDRYAVKVFSDIFIPKGWQNTKNI
ncbi:MAG: deoxyguanosinetriphosphate triphosphohydrolase [Christensenellaceae bacterium]|nr:deoxyguanosinetriphosphate triphosphohydrolase [Christensenellaceae bacterium]